MKEFLKFYFSKNDWVFRRSCVFLIVFFGLFYMGFSVFEKDSSTVAQLVILLLGTAGSYLGACYADDKRKDKKDANGADSSAP